MINITFTNGIGIVSTPNMHQAHPQIWYSFNAQPEDEQEKAVRPVAVVCGEEQDTEKRFKRIDGRIRSLLVHNKHLPMVRSVISLLDCVCQ